MKPLLKLFPLTDSRNAASQVMIRIFSLFLISSFFVVSFLLFSYSSPHRTYVFTNCLIAILAVTTCGFLLGFLFGIPRSVQFRFDKEKKSFTQGNSQGGYFADNTNLEEISDWLTKIIVGFTLIQSKKILIYLDKAAHSIASSFPSENIDLFIFAYCLILYFSGLGFFGGYFWSRTLFGSILVQSRKEQEDLINLANRNLSTACEQNTVLKGLDSKVSFSNFKDRVSNLLSATPIRKSDDTQKDRWGGEQQKNDRILKVNVQATVLNLFEVTIEVASTSSEKPITDTVVILLDKTFPEQAIYIQPQNNKAVVTVIAYEAFTVAALCDDLNTQLELDMQQMKGLPPNFYWK